VGARRISASGIITIDQSGLTKSHIKISGPSITGIFEGTGFFCEVPESGDSSEIAILVLGLVTAGLCSKYGRRVTHA
jgi:hypothetical protein